MRALVAVLAATTLVGAGWIARDLSVDDPAPRARTTQVAQGGGVTAAPVDGAEPVAAVAQALGPAVVQIGMGDGLGSGIVYDASGLVLTNAHVVGGDRTVEVTFSDGSSTEGRVLGSDSLTDVAVVAIDPPEDLVVAALAETSPAVGDLAVAMGSPFGLEQSVTSGVVSAVGRVVSNPQGATVEMLQTDAPINPGNSGGALASRTGEVIGMNTLIYSQSGENNGIGFAIPIQTALEVAGRIVAGESLERGFLGVQSQQSTDGSRGAMVAAVTPGSAADRAGLEVGDLIVGIDGTEVAGSPELAAAIQSHRPGDTVVIEVDRDGEVIELEATLDALTPE
jgi:S1-C subfamily serine protease